MNDPHAALCDQLLNQVLDGPGDTSPALRNAAANGRGLPDDLQALVAQIHAHAYRITDADIARVQPAYGDDRLFEVVVSAALGAARRRLDAGLRALEEA